MDGWMDAWMNDAWMEMHGWRCMDGDGWMDEWMED
jgi:hypothetical protein